MPYGVAKTAGGDTPQNDARMEKCISDVMAKGNDKLTAILYCKSSLFGRKHGRK